MSRPRSAGPARRVACPHLRLNNGLAPRGRPSDGHGCALESSGTTPPGHRHQAQFCLSPDWKGCSRHAAVLQPPPAPLSLATRRILQDGPQIAKRATAPGRGWRAPLLGMLVTLPLALLLLGAGTMLLLALSPATAAPGDAPAVAAPPPPTATATPLQRPDSLVALVAPTPIATFVPVTENVTPQERGPLHIAPSVPEPDTVTDIRQSRPEVDWPEQAAVSAPTRVWSTDVPLDASVVTVGNRVEDLGGQLVRFYEVAEFAAGWHDNSVLPGESGNTVLAGHHNTLGRVFEHVNRLEPGNFLYVEADGRIYPYMVVVKRILPETIVDDSVRAQNGRWIAPTSDERLTLVTCWPPESNTHRVIVVAVPAR